MRRRNSDTTAVSALAIDSRCSVDGWLRHRIQGALTFRRNWSNAGSMSDGIPSSFCPSSEWTMASSVWGTRIRPGDRSLGRSVWAGTGRSVEALSPPVASVAPAKAIQRK